MEYWHSLQEFVLQGRMDQVCQLKMVIGYLLKLVEIGSKLVEIGSKWLKLGRKWLKLGRNWLKLGRNWLRLG